MATSPSPATGQAGRLPPHAMTHVAEHVDDPSVSTRIVALRLQRCQVREQLATGCWAEGQEVSITAAGGGCKTSASGVEAVDGLGHRNGAEDVLIAS